MGLEVLVPIIMGALLRVAGKIGDGVLGVAEETATEGAKSILAKVRSWWSGDAAASDDLSKFEGEPEIYTPVIEARLVKKLGADADIRHEFEALVEQMGPQIDVFQSIAEASGVTGAKIEELAEGHVRVDQRIEHAHDVTGVDIKRMGPSR